MALLAALCSPQERILCWKDSRKLLPTHTQQECLLLSSLDPVSPCCFSTRQLSSPGDSFLCSHSGHAQHKTLLWMEPRVWLSFLTSMECRVCLYGGQEPTPVISQIQAVAPHCSQVNRDRRALLGWDRRRACHTHVVCGVWWLLPLHGSSGYGGVCVLASVTFKKSLASFCGISPQWCSL